MCAIAFLASVCPEILTISYIQPHNMALPTYWWSANQFKHTCGYFLQASISLWSVCGRLLIYHNKHALSTLQFSTTQVKPSESHRQKSFVYEQRAWMGFCSPSSLSLIWDMFQSMEHHHPSLAIVGPFATCWLVVSTMRKVEQMKKSRALWKTDGSITPDSKMCIIICLSLFFASAVYVATV